MNNWLGLRTSNEGNIILEINKTNNNVGGGEEKWCILSIELKNKHVNFSLAGEIITDYEIKEISNNLKKVLDGEIEETVVFETLEPYQKYVFNKDNVRININFGLSKDFYSLYLDKYNIKALYEYLNKFN